MKINRHIKISLIINCALLGVLIALMLLHNLRTSISGQEDQFFFFLFIIVFFIFPVSIVYTLIVFIVIAVKRAHEKQARIRDENV